MYFGSLQAAKTFINNQAYSYTSNLISMGVQLGQTDYVWHMNVAGLMSMFFGWGYSPQDQFAQQALNDAVQAGYIYFNRLGGVLITPNGYNNIGNW